MLKQEQCYAILNAKAKQCADEIMTSTSKALHAVLPSIINRQFLLQLTIDLQSMISSLAIKIYERFCAERELFSLNQVDEFSRLWEDPNGTFSKYDSLSAQIYYCFAVYIVKRIEEEVINRLGGDGDIPNEEAFLQSLRKIIKHNTVYIEWNALFGNNVVLLGENIYIGANVTIGENTLIFSGVTIGVPPPLMDVTPAGSDRICIGANAVINSRARVFCSIGDHVSVAKEAMIKHHIPDYCDVLPHNMIVTRGCGRSIVGVKADFTSNTLKVFGENLSVIAKASHYTEAGKPCISFSQAKRDEHSITFRIHFEEECDLCDFDQMMVKIEMDNNEYTVLDITQDLWESYRRGKRKHA